MDTTTVIEKQFRFPKKIGDKWIKALKSKKYKQSGGFLKNSEGYCCLGVLGTICGLTKKELEGKYWLRLHDVHVEGIEHYFEKAEQLINIPKEAIGADFDNMLVEELSRRNDQKIPFIEIAEWIKNNVEFYE